MKASEYIAALQSLIDEHGDLEVDIDCACGDEAQSDCTPYLTYYTYTGSDNREVLQKFIALGEVECLY